MPNKDTTRFRELVKMPRKDLALDVMNLERRVSWAEECMSQMRIIIDEAFNSAADEATKDKNAYNPVTDKLLKGLRMTKSVLEEMDWTEEGK